RLASALTEFAHQSDQPILFSNEITDAKDTAGVHGDLTPEAALKALLKGTGLTFRTTVDRTILVERPRSTSASGQTSRESKSVPASEDAGSRLRLAQVDPARSSSAASVDEPPKQALETILVTAQKRSERPQDVPVPVTAISGATLVQTN